MASFDNMSHEWTVKFIEHRVADRRILRLIQKWLKAGVSEDGQWSETSLGTPQGAVPLPLLANVYLHYAFDDRMEAWRKKIAKGDVVVVRYADDPVVGFQYRAEAERFWQDFRKRLAKFGLELHADKTRLIEFGRFAARDRERRREGNQRPSRSWVPLTCVGSATATEPSSSGGSRRRSGWSRSSKPLRPSFNAGSIIARPKSVPGFARRCWATTNTMLFQATCLSCASLPDALVGRGGAFSSVAVNAPGCDGLVSTHC